MASPEELSAETVQVSKTLQVAVSRDTLSDVGNCVGDKNPTQANLGGLVKDWDKLDNVKDAMMPEVSRARGKRKLTDKGLSCTIAVLEQSATAKN